MFLTSNRTLNQAQSFFSGSQKFRRSIAKTSLGLMICLFFLSGPAGAEVISKIAAVVNSDIITTRQLDMKLADFLATQAKGEQVSPEKMNALRLELLDRLIEETLVQQKIRELNIQVSEQEIEEAIGDVLRQNQINREQLIQAVEAQGLAFEAYRNKLREQMLRLKLVNREVQSKVDVDNEELLEYFRNHIDDYREPPVLKLSHVRFPLPVKPVVEEVEQIRQEAQAAREQLRAGAPFQELLKNLAASGRASGGDMGTLQEKDLSPLLRDALQGLGEGDFSQVIETPGGFLILHVDKRTPGRIRNFDSVKESIRQTLLDTQREKRFQEWSKELRKQAYIDVRL